MRALLARSTCVEDRIDYNYYMHRCPSSQVVRCSSLKPLPWVPNLTCMARSSVDLAHQQPAAVAPAATARSAEAPRSADRGAQSSSTSASGSAPVSGSPGPPSGESVPVAWSEGGDAVVDGSASGVASVSEGDGTVVVASSSEGDGTVVAASSPPPCGAPGVGAGVGDSMGIGVGPGVGATALGSAAQVSHVVSPQSPNVKHHSPRISLSGLQQ